VPRNGNFIKVTGYNDRDWLSAQNDNFWQGVNGINCPCPSGYRLPTAAEWEAEIKTWSTPNEAGAFASPLKLPLAGFRDFDGKVFIFGNPANYSGQAYYWSSTVSKTLARILSFDSAFPYPNIGNITASERARGNSVRCIKD
jgi:uncharacterized protein (TIGR02145 family)